jgi:hypothetical protein
MPRDLSAKADSVGERFKTTCREILKPALWPSDKANPRRATIFGEI